MAKILPIGDGTIIKKHLENINLKVGDEIEIWGKLENLLDNEIAYDKKVKIIKITDEKNKLLLEDVNGNQYLTIVNEGYMITISELIVTRMLLNKLEELFNNGWLLLNTYTLKVDINDTCEIIDSIEKIETLIIR